MKKILFIFVMFVIVALFFGSCEKSNETSTNAINFSIDASAFPTASDLMVYLVPSEKTDHAIILEAGIGENALTLTADEKSSLQVDAYFTVILFDQNGQYLTQNFFPFAERVLTLTEE